MQMSEDLMVLLNFSGISVSHKKAAFLEQAEWVGLVGKRLLCWAALSYCCQREIHPGDCYLKTICLTKSPGNWSVAYKSRKVLWLLCSSVGVCTSA